MHGYEMGLFFSKVVFVVLLLSSTYLSWYFFLFYHLFILWNIIHFLFLYWPENILAWRWFFQWLAMIVGFLIMVATSWLTHPSLSHLHLWIRFLDRFIKEWAISTSIEVWWVVHGATIARIWLISWETWHLLARIRLGQKLGAFALLAQVLI